jgi:sarcosine oxidase
VRTRSAEYYSRSLVITAGAWSTRLLRDLNLPIRVLRKFVGWFPCDNPDLRADRGCPTFLFELPHGAFYGFPSFDQRLVKVAEHTGGDVVEHLERIDRQCNPADLVPLNEFSSRYLGRVSSTPQRHSVCLYSMSPDGHFIVDHHPTYRNVVFAAGFSGHGFKFCPVIGEALTDLVLNGMTRLPIEFLSRSRFATPS